VGDSHATLLLGDADLGTGNNWAGEGCTYSTCQTDFSSAFICRTHVSESFLVPDVIELTQKIDILVDGVALDSWEA